MAASSSSAASFFGVQQDDQSHLFPSDLPAAAPLPPPNHQSPPQPLEAPPQKKKRNQPRTPNSDVEVVSLSPTTLMATNRFICEVCNKGFQREQNLQLHRRGHNLPWKLKQKSTKEVKKKVYLCPETTCVHNDPLRALGDLTGIKKHYYRKHGEKKWKCEKCSKCYAVQSDWKAHSKTCGTKEYRCDCGTLFSRRDSFVTHRAFCDALAQESARHPPSLSSNHFPYGQGNNTSSMIIRLSHMGAPRNHDNNSGDVLRLGSGGGGTASRASSVLSSPNASGYFIHEQSPSFHDQQDHHHQRGFLAANNDIKQSPMSFQQNLMQFSHDNHNSPSSSFINLSFLSGNHGVTSATSNPNAAVPSGNLMISNHFDCENAVEEGEGSPYLFPKNLMSSADRISSRSVPSLFTSSMRTQNATPHMSATALLQKAAQIGSTSSTNNNNNNASSILRRFGNGIYGDNESESNLHDLMNSFSNPGAMGVDSPFGSYGGMNKGLNTDKESMTRDFLGVGQIVKSSMTGINSEGVGSPASMNVNSGDIPASTSPPYGIHHAEF